MSGQPWRHKNQGERILFGGYQALLSIHDGSDDTLQHPPVAVCRKVNELKYVAPGESLRRGTGARDFWITGGGEVASLDTKSTSSTRVYFKGHVYDLGGLYDVHDVNAYAGRIWICASNGNVLHIYSAALNQAVSSVYNYDFSGSVLLMPAFDSQCTALIFGFAAHYGWEFDLASADLMTVGLASNGSVSGVTPSTWSTNVVHYDAVFSDVAGTPVDSEPTSMPAPNHNKTTPNMSLPELPWVAAASSGVEYSTYPPSYGGSNVAQTLDATISDLLGRPTDIQSDGFGGTWEYHFELSDGPSSFAASYPPEYNLTMTFSFAGFAGSPIATPVALHPCFYRIATVSRMGVHKDSGGNVIGSSQDDYLISSRRVGRDYNYSSFIIRGLKTGIGSFGFTGEKPIGWVRDAIDGIVRQVSVKMTSVGSASASATGQGYGAQYRCTMFPAGGIQAEIDAIFATLPTSHAYTASQSSSIDSAGKEGVYIGTELQYERVFAKANPTTSYRAYLQYQATDNYNGELTPSATPVTTNTNYGLDIANFSGVSDTVSNVSETLSEESSAITFINYQMRLVYQQANYHAASIDNFALTDDVSTFKRRRDVRKNGTTIWSENYTAASNAAKRVPLAVELFNQHGVRFATCGIFGKKGNVKLLLSLFDQHGIGDPENVYWGASATVTPTDYCIVLDDAGNVYQTIPTGVNTSSATSSFNNDALGSDFVVINVDPSR